VNDVLEDITTVGITTGSQEQASQLVRTLRTRIEETSLVQVDQRPRVLCLEWLDPPFVGGHWIPEMVEIAGGRDVLGIPGKPSFETNWQNIANSDPDMILVMPCGYHRREVEEELQKLRLPKEWYELRAVRNGSVFTTDASSHFSRPGPRIVDGIEVMVRLFRQYSQSKTRKSVKRSEFDKPRTVSRRR